MRTIHSGVGAITENDVMLAGIDRRDHHRLQRPPGRERARDAANRDKVSTSAYYRVIYQAIEDMEKAMKGMLAPEFTRERCIGHAEVRNVFKITGVGICRRLLCHRRQARSAMRRFACCATTWWCYEGKLDPR